MRVPGAAEPDPLAALPGYGILTPEWSGMERKKRLVYKRRQVIRPLGGPQGDFANADRAS